MNDFKRVKNIIREGGEDELEEALGVVEESLHQLEEFSGANKNIDKAVDLLRKAQKEIERKLK